MMRKLRIDDLTKGQPGISPPAGAFLAEAAAFCMVENGHQLGVTLKLEGDFKEQFRVSWTHIISDLHRRTWADTEEVTEYGAMGIAVLLTLQLTNYKILARLKKGQRTDYLLGDPTNINHPSAKLEVSGIWTEKPGNTINIRIGRKKKRINELQNRSFPIYIAVIEFNSPKSKFIKV